MSNIPHSAFRTPHSHTEQLQHYFDGVGFERWSAIYGVGPLSRIRSTIRVGHGRMLAQAATWLAESFPAPAGHPTLLDAGCGTGLFSIVMAQRGFRVTGVDIAPRMVAAAQAAAQTAGLTEPIHFRTGDADSVTGQFDVVACFDVLVHYPRAAFVPLCTHLAQRSDHTLLLTYAPYSRPLALLHWLGGRFPQGERRTEIQMIPDQVVATTLTSAGLRVRRTAKISQGFYHVTLLEASRS
jgi:magnesium-protoporphyrin O-methyltransferase